ncbi:MAG: methylmalonyl-CoA mutase, partial [Flavobacteriales bacterium]|nr:methylmalonyl-CoA mutase [Flavobacteriales bacterium]
RGCGHIKIFAGGGGTILPEEINELHDYGITRIYHPDDGREMGLQGMINDLMEQSDYATGANLNGEPTKLIEQSPVAIGRLISAAENFPEENKVVIQRIQEEAAKSNVPVLGITGTGGAGKSSLVDELVRRFLIDFEDKKIGIISVDPSKRKTGGALLGDRIRMNSIFNDRCYMRSLATRQSNLAVSKHVQEAVDILKAAKYDLVILETSGIGQSDTEIVDHSDVSMYVMTPEYGAASQLEKIDMLDFADVIALNKFDKRGALDAIRDVKKQYKRNRQLWEIADEDIPVFGTIASQFNDPGTNTLYKKLMDVIVERTGSELKSNFETADEMSEKIFVIPPKRVRYLSEISETIRGYNEWVEKQGQIAQKLYALKESMAVLDDDQTAQETLKEKYEQLVKDLDPHNLDVIEGWPEKQKRYRDDLYTFKVRDKEIKIQTHTESLSHTQIPKVSLPRYTAWGDVLKWNLQENVPGEFPYAAGVFPFKREGEDPTRMFAGEGGPERTNKRFHYVSLGMP